MKACLNCNRVNLDKESVCIECGKADFANIIQKEESNEEATINYGRVG